MIDTSKYSEAWVKQFEGCEKLNHFVVKFKRYKWFDAEFREDCYKDIEIFCNKLFKLMIKNYSRPSAKVQCLCFWEIARGKSFHCHCIVGWPIINRRVKNIQNLDIEEAFKVSALKSLESCSIIENVWFKDVYVDQGLIDYCLKEFVDSDNLYSDISKVELWKGGKEPKEI